VNALCTGRSNELARNSNKGFHITSSKNIPQPSNLVFCEVGDTLARYLTFGALKMTDTNQVVRDQKKPTFIESLFPLNLTARRKLNQKYQR
jgi:hypothetical protein